MNGNKSLGPIDFKKIKDVKSKELIDSLPYYAMLIDQNHRIIMANRAVRTELGINPEKIIGKYCPQAIHGVDHPIEECPLEEAVIKGEIVEKEYYDRKLGKWFSSAIYPLADKNIYLHIVHDITKRKETEENVKESYNKLQRILNQGIKSICKIVENRDPYTAGHQENVSKLGQEIALRMGLEDKKVEAVRVAGSLHDVGKINVPIDILSKPGRLIQEEYNLIKLHPEAGYNILKDIEFPWPVAQIVYQHHERINGKGYPRRLKSNQIYLEAKILAVADVIEAMTAHRPYRPALRVEKAINEMKENRGILYESTVVDVALDLINTDFIYTLRKI